MAETPKQRIRRILNTLPLPDDARRDFDDALENVTEEECGDILYVFDEMLEDNPELLDQIVEALDFYQDPNSGD